jgi:hypothetical protein
MLDQLVYVMDAWTKAARKKQPTGLGKPPPAQGGAIRRLPAPSSPPVLPLNPGGVPLGTPPALRPGDLGPGIAIPPQLAHPPVIQRGTPAGGIGHPATVNTNPPPLRVPPRPGAVPGDPVQDRIQQLEERLKRAEEDRAVLEGQIKQPKGKEDRGTPNARGTYPYWQGHGPTSKFAHEQFQEDDARMRAAHPEWYHGGASNRVKPVPPGFEDWDWTDFVMSGGQPAWTPTEKAEYLKQQKQQKQQLQMQRPDIYGAPGTTFRDPQSPSYRQPGGSSQRRGANPQVGPGGTSGPLGANQRALDDLNRFRQAVPPPVVRAPATGRRRR